MAAAIDGSRVRRSKFGATAPTRSPLQVAAVSVWPTVAMSLMIQAVGFLLSARGSWGSPGRFPWEVLIAWASMILFHVALGYLLGMAFPIVAAAPLALLLSYVWLGFTWSVSYIPLRYLSGLAISGCCAVYSELAPQAVPAVAVFSLSGVVAVALIIALQGRPRRPGIFRLAVVPVFPVAVGTVVGLSLASGLGSYPSPPRATNDLKCEVTSIAEICFYPEQLWNTSPEPVSVVRAALQNIHDAGIITPDRVSGSLNELDDADTLMMMYRRNFTRATTIHSLSSWYGYIFPPYRTCKRDAANNNPSPWDFGDVVGGIVYYYATKGEMDPFNSPPEAQAVTSILAYPPAEQRAWLSLAINALRSCDAPFPALPANPQ